jgi:hypothetical protein
MYRIAALIVITTLSSIAHARFEELEQMTDQFQILAACRNYSGADQMACARAADAHLARLSAASNNRPARPSRLEKSLQRPDDREETAKRVESNRAAVSDTLRKRKLLLEESGRAFLTNFAKFDLLGIRLGDSQTAVTNKLAQLFPSVVVIENGRKVNVPRHRCGRDTKISTRQFDCMGQGSEKNARGEGLDKTLQINLTDASRAYEIWYEQSGVVLGVDASSCLSKVQEIMNDLVARFGNPTTRTKSIISWGSAMSRDEWMKDASPVLARDEDLLVNGSRGTVNNSSTWQLWKHGYIARFDCSSRGTMNSEATLTFEGLEDAEKAPLKTDKPRF